MNYRKPMLVILLTFYACDLSLLNLVRKLEDDTYIAIEWFENNYMKLNKEKCHFLISGHKYEHFWVNVGENKIWESQSEKLLGVEIDPQLKFDVHIILREAGRKLSIIARMSHILSFTKLRILMKSFFDSQF